MAIKNPKIGDILYHPRFPSQKFKITSLKPPMVRRYPDGELLGKEMAAADFNYHWRDYVKYEVGMVKELMKKYGEILDS